MTRRIRIIAGLIAVALIAATVSVLPVLPVPAAKADTGTGSPTITLDRTVAPKTLFGTDVAVTLTAKNSTTTDGYNLSFRDVIPAGATLDGGDAPSSSIPQADGTTVLIWSNQSDLLAGTTSAVSYRYRYPTNGTAPFVEGATLSSTANAYLHTNARTVPAFDATTGVAVAGSYSGSAASTSGTQLVPYTVTKKLTDAPENEMLRGVHDHKYVYEITVTNNTATTTSAAQLDDYLPADLEFLGCTNADTSATGTEEYTGAGRISSTGFPALTGCTTGGTPTATTTGTIDPDGPTQADGTGRLPSAIYTHVVWNLGTLTANQVVTIQYAVAVPLRENVASSAPATANLDNNTGALTTDEEPVVNYAVVGATNGGTAYSVGAYETATAEDVAVQKTVDTGTIVQGQTSTWTLKVESSEYATSTSDITVKDVVPSGLDVASAGGGSVAAPASDGTITITWTIPGYTAKNGTTTLTYTTTTRATYRGTGTPVAAEDSWSNKVGLTSTATVRTGDTSTGPARADDDSAASQQAGDISIDKRVLPSASTPNANCTGASPSAFVDDQTASGDTPFHPGDTVCWLLRVNFPGNLNTLQTRIQDILPTGFDYTSSYATGANTVTIASGPTNDSGTITWTVGDSSTVAPGGKVFEVVVASTIASQQQATPAGTVQGNLMKVLFRNTGNSAYQLRDQSNVKVSRPLLAPTKAADPTSQTANGTVAFTVNVVNSGTQATTAQVKDLLPTGFSCAAITPVPSGATCSDTPSPSTITWAAVAVAKSSTTTLNYTATMPAGVAAGDSFTNTAQVPSYTSTTNVGGTVTYAPSPTPAATATVSVPSATVSKTATATAKIGDTVTWVVTGRIPANTTLYGNPALVDTVPSGFTITGATATIAGNAATPTTSGSTVTVALGGSSYSNTTSSEQTVVLTITGTLQDVAGNTRGGVKTNSATLSWTGTSDSATRRATGTAATTVVEPVLGLVKTDDAPGHSANPGSTVTYTLTASNTGTSTAFDTVITDTVPAEVTPQVAGGGPLVDGATIAGTGGGVWTSASRTITFPARDIAAGGSSAVTFLVTVNDPLTSNATIVNNARAVTTSQSGTPSGERTSTSTQNTGYVATAQNTLANPFISLTKTRDRATATVGERITYTFTAVVPTSTEAYDVTLVDQLPTNVSFEGMTGASCTGGTPCPTPSVIGTPAASDTTVAFFLGDLPAASTARTFTITYTGIVRTTATRGEVMTNTGRIRLNTADRITGTPTSIPASFDIQGNSASASVTEVEPRLGIAKSVAGGTTGAGTAASPRRATPGTVLDYTVVATNSGTSPAYDMTVRDVLPNLTPCSTVTNISGGGTCAGGIITWTVAGPVSNVAGSNTVTLTYRVTVPTTLTSADEDASGPELVNTVTIPSAYGLPAATRTDPQNSGISYRTYTAGPADADVELDLASIAGTIWEDWATAGASVGTLDPSDPRLSGVGVTVTYAGADGVFGTADDEAHTTTTGTGGTYRVDRLPGGNYRVAVNPASLPAGLAPAYDADGVATPNLWTGTLGEAQDRTGVDFSYRGTGSIGDTVWFDRDGSGTQNGEPGLPGFTVTLTGTGPAGEPLSATTTTNASGAYTFPNLPAGTYTVTVTRPGGSDWIVVSDPQGAVDGSSTVALAAGQNITTQDFGYAGTASLGDRVWLDRDRDGVQDADEPGLVGVQLSVTWAGPDGTLGTADDAAFTTTTGTNGAYSLGGLPTGNYRVSVTGGLPAAALATYDLDGIVTPGRADTTLTTGQARTDVDFGYDARTSIGDFVWWDADRDGVQDAGEPGLPNVPVTVTYAGQDGTFGTADDLVYTTTTDATGHYGVTNISEGLYRVRVTPPTGFAPVTDADSTTPGSGDNVSQVTLGAAGNQAQDFGYAGTGSIGDRVWFDRDGDGVQDADEPGLGGVTITLSTTVNGTAVTITTTTTASGAYSFTGLPSGTYTVTETVPSGYRATYDVDGGTLSSTSVTLTAGQARTDVDFGLNGSASLAGTVYNDRNANAAQGTGEPGIGGVTMTATGTTVIGTVTVTTVTAADGSWSFPNLPAGSWTVGPTAGIPAGYAEVSESDSSVNAAITTTLANGQTLTGQTFGYRGSGSIGDTIYLDQNGTHSPTGQPGVPNQRVDLQWNGPNGNIQTWTTTTDGSGAYRFDYLPAGSFTVTVVGGITATATNTADPDGGTANTSAVTLAAGASNLAQDFGYAAAAAPNSNALGDLVWWDQDGDGTRGTGEPGIGGATVTALWYGPDGIRGTADDITLTRTTNAAGAYTFTGLPDGTYAVTVTAGVYPGLVPSVDTADTGSAVLNGSSVVSLAGGQVRSDVDFGYVGTGTLGDHVYLDEDGDGTQDPSEPGIPGATVTVVWAGPDGVRGNGDDVTWTRTTDADGAWKVDRLPAGPYTITVTGVPATLTNTGFPSGGGNGTVQLALGSGESRLDQDFGYQGSASLGDTIWLDVDGDGKQTGNEPGLSGIIVTVRSSGADGVLDTADDVVISRTTDAAGHYSAAGLPAGAVRVSYDSATLPKGDVPTADLDAGASLSSTELVLAPGDARTDVDFVVRGTGRVAGVVYDDANGNRARGSRERGVGGVQVVVTWNGPSGPVSVTTVSASDGSWSVSGLPSGSYTVRETPSTFPRGYRPSTAASLSLTLDPGASASVLFGIIRSSGLAGTGLDALPWLGLGALLVVAGVLLLLRRRRRES